MRDPDLAARVVRCVDGAYMRSRNARQTRRDLNRRNWDFYHGKQDWTHKVEGQSRVFLPDLPITIEQSAAQLEQQLTAFSDWFRIDGPDTPLFDPQVAQALLQVVLRRLYTPDQSPLTVQTVLADALKQGLIESEIVLKVYGVDDHRPTFQLALADDGVTRVVQQAQIQTFSLAIEVIGYEDFFPDPGPHRRYDIHEVQRRLHELRENPAYDQTVVDTLLSASISEADTDKRRRTGAELPIEDPTSVRVREYWGDLVDWATGEVLATNVLATTCRGQVLRYDTDGTPWTPNPNWSQRRPFIRAALLRTPNAPTHKAMLDLAVPVAEAENEIFSLMIDGGIQAVQGVKQIHPDLLENPDDVSNGIPPGFTAILRRNVPAGQKFVERVDDYTAPQYADLMLNRAAQARGTALASTDLSIGRLPARQVKATEVVAAESAADTLYAALAARLEEAVIEPLLELAWLTIWQGLDDFTAPELMSVLGPERASLCLGLDPAERFALAANAGVAFTARGLRNLQGRVRDFQKDVTLLNLIGSNPALAQAFDEKYSVVRLLEHAMQAINIDPTTIERRADDPRLAMELLRQPGQQGTPPATSDAPSTENDFAPPNPTGFHGGLN